MGSIIATIFLVAYLFAAALEAWRPGFVTFFWNPQWLLFGFVFGLILTWKAPERKTRKLPFLVRLILAIVGGALVWITLPAGGTTQTASFATFLLLLSLL